MRKLLFAILLFALSGCSADPTNSPAAPVSESPQVSSYLAGKVEFWEGDFMPMSDPSNPSGEVRPVIRTVFIYEPTRPEDVVADGYGGFYSSIDTELKAITSSGDDGLFEVRLDPGLYSVFVLEGDQYYANGWRDGFIQPVEVTAGETTDFTIKIDYAAYY